MWGDHVIAVAPSGRVVAGHAALAFSGFRPNWCQAGRRSTERRTGAAAFIGGPNHGRILMVERLPLPAVAIVRLGRAGVNGG